MSASAPTSCKIQSLHLYPIKSMGAVDVDELLIGETGPLFDRQWMLVDEAGQFLSQRQLPKLAQLRPRFKAESLLALEVSGQEFELPFRASFSDKEPPSVGSDQNIERRLVQVWKSAVIADQVQVPGLNEALSDYLEKPCSLVSYGDHSQREVTKGGRPRGAQFRFADSSSLLITNQSSLDDLNTRLKDPIPMTRFRPNIVVNGPLPWQEDRWALLKSQDFQIEIIAGCGRCVMINKDQTTGESPSREPLLVLSEFRRRGTSVDFGVLGVHRLEAGGRVRLFKGQSLDVETSS